MEGSDGVPIDLFVSKTKLHITSSAFNLKFTDSSSNLVFSVDRPPPPRSDLGFKRLLSDSSGSPLIFISHNQKAASWEGFSAEGNNNNNHPLLFRVERTTKSFTRVEFQVFLNNQNSEDFKMRGSPFYRSCTIYTKPFSAAAGMLRSRLTSTLRHRGGDGPSRWSTPGHQVRPNGYFLNRTPPPPGQSRKWEDWELPCYVTSFLTIVILGVGLNAKPDLTLETWAHQKALERIEANKQIVAASDSE